MDKEPIFWEDLISLGFKGYFFFILIQIVSSAVVILEIVVTGSRFCFWSEFVNSDNVVEILKGVFSPIDFFQLE